MTIISNSWFKQNMCLTKLLIIAQFDLMNSGIFKHLSSTFKALNLGEKIQVLSRTFKDAWEPCTQKNAHIQALRPEYVANHRVANIPAFTLGCQ